VDNFAKSFNPGSIAFDEVVADNNWEPNIVKHAIRSDHDTKNKVCATCGGRFGSCSFFHSHVAYDVTSEEQIHRIRARYALSQLGPDAEPTSRQRMSRQAQRDLDYLIEHGEAPWVS
jgi:hypothetical protein